MSWTSIADLLTHDPTPPVALIGAPMDAGSVTPGRCDLAPELVRRAMQRISTYDLVEQLEIVTLVRDAGDMAVQGLMPADGFAIIQNGVSSLTARHALTIVLGGNNAVTRPVAHSLGLPLGEIGLITLDAHFDMREIDQGPLNGNPVRCLLEDGLPGANICQIGLAPFANTRKMHEDALAAGIGIYDLDDVLTEGIEAAIDDALERLSHVDAILVDFDIDVIDRGQFPGAPGARPGGLPVRDFFRAARRLAEEERVRAVDLTEFDPFVDGGQLSALTAARWVAEILAGFSRRTVD
jgi:arginase family enzyme